MAPIVEAEPNPIVARAVVDDPRLWTLPVEELERRWAAVRDLLQAHGLQALVVQGYEEKIGGAVRWLTDVAPGYPRTIIFHANDLMTQIDHGPEGEIRRIDGRDPNRRGVGELATTWALHGGHFTSGLMANQTLKLLRERGYARIGVVNPRAWPYGFFADLASGLEGAGGIVDVTDAFDLLRARKSEMEISLIRATCAIQDEVFSRLVNWIEPGLRDFEINAFLDYELQLRGADRGVYIAASAPSTAPSVFAYRSLQGRTLRRGDHINVLLESNGPGGGWGEMGRLISFGPPSEAMREAHEICVQAQAQTARQLTPGADPAAVFAAHNAFMTAHGSAPERRIHSHGQGYDAVERPFIRSDETMSLEAGMMLSVHPAFAGAGVYATLCDNVLIKEDGGAELLHATPKRIFEL